VNQREVDILEEKRIAMGRMIKLQHSKALGLIYVPPVLPFNNSTFCPQSVLVCYILEQTSLEF